MDSGGEIEAQVLEFQKIEKVFEDRDIEVFDTLLFFGLVNQLKTKIKTFEDHGTDLHGFFRSHLYFLYPKQTLNFPNFVEWCTSNDSSSERVIMDATKSKIIFPINALVFSRLPCSYPYLHPKP